MKAPRTVLVPVHAEAEVTQGSIDLLLASPDRTLRQSAWERYADGYLGVRNTLAANLSGGLLMGFARAPTNTSFKTMKARMEMMRTLSVSPVKLR